MNKYLVCVNNNNLTDIPNVLYAYPLKDYCVGFLKEFTLEEITKPNAYLFINRLLDTLSIDNLKNLLTNLPPNIKGLIFEDLGVYELIKDTNLEKILYATHANCSVKSINTYLKKMTSVFISPDITLEETKKILETATKPLVIYGLGHLPYMYSRRTLNTNYAKHFNIENNNPLKLTESVTKRPFISVENKYGTVLYDDKIYNAHALMNELNIKYIFLNLNLTKLTVEEAIKTFLNDNNENFSAFLKQKTIYRLKEK